MSQGMINNRLFDMDRVDVRSTVGATEIWEVQNVVGMDHPFHLHGFRFQILDRNGVPEPFPSWKDSVNVPKHESVRLIVRFDDHPGKWMLHCHILDHEDKGMMGILQIDPRERVMRSSSKGTRWGLAHSIAVVLGAGMIAVSGCSSQEGGMEAGAGAEMAANAEANASVERGRLGVLTHGCGDCHGGFDNPDAPGFLAGVMIPIQEFAIPMDPVNPSFTYPLTPGPGYFITRPRNITPDMDTGIGRFTERQIFNALRYGLRPEDTPDVEITSAVPGEGNFPAVPRYLAPPMPWPSFRHMSDQDLWDMAAYLKRGLKPVTNSVADSEGPPDFWAGFYADPAVGFGPYPARPFPASQEVGG